MAKPEKILKKIKKVENIVDEFIETSDADIDMEKLIIVSRRIRKINDEIIKDIDDILKNNLT